MTANATTIQINHYLSPLVRQGIAVDQGFAYSRPLAGGLQEVTFPNSEELSLAKLRQSYVEGYGAIVRARAYNVLLDDGAVLQMSYLFQGEHLTRHRLAYLGSPGTTLDGAGQLFDEDAPMSGTAPPATLFRFDYDDALHPPDANHLRSHLTIGDRGGRSDRKECRIPVSSPLTPDQFLRFVFNHFYHAPAFEIPHVQKGFASTISDAERQEIHVTVPAPVS